MKKFKIVSEYVPSMNCQIVRPSSALGTCGFHPKGWQIAAVKHGQSAINAFLSVNPNWNREEIELIGV